MWFPLSPGPIDQFCARMYNFHVVAPERQRSPTQSKVGFANSRRRDEEWLRKRPPWEFPSFGVLTFDINSILEN